MIIVPELYSSVNWVTDTRLFGFNRKDTLCCSQSFLKLDIPTCCYLLRLQRQYSYFILLTMAGQKHPPFRKQYKAIYKHNYWPTQRLNTSAKPKIQLSRYHLPFTTFMRALSLNVANMFWYIIVYNSKCNVISVKNKQGNMHWLIFKRK